MGLIISRQVNSPDHHHRRLRIAHLVRAAARDALPRGDVHADDAGQDAHERADGRGGGAARREQEAGAYDDGSVGLRV